MPSSGKTTIASHLALHLNYKFIDLDHMVERYEGRSLIEVLETEGAQYFLSLQYSFLQQIGEKERVIISTAGSMIYHPEAMAWLAQNSRIVMIDTPLTVIEDRLSRTPKAVVGLKEKGLYNLWKERMPLYKEYAEFSIKTEGKELFMITEEIALGARIP
jgi:shikimate kinase